MWLFRTILTRIVLRLSMYAFINHDVICDSVSGGGGRGWGGVRVGLWGWRGGYRWNFIKTWSFLCNTWSSDAIWWQRSGSTLAQVMACCLMAPSHCLNQCWLSISEVSWHSPESNFTENAQDILSMIWAWKLWIWYFSHITERQWVKTHLLDLTVILNYMILKFVLLIYTLSTCEIALKWMPQSPIDINVGIGSINCWCHQATSHCLSQCWPRWWSNLCCHMASLRQWVKILTIDSS